MNRLALKTTSYGITHFFVATAVAYAITGNLAMAVGIGLIEPLVQTVVFAVHDWLWERKRGGLEFKRHSCKLAAQKAD